MIAQLAVPNVTVNPLFFSKSFGDMGFSAPGIIATTFYYLGSTDTKTRFWRPEISQVK